MTNLPLRYAQALWRAVCGLRSDTLPGKQVGPVTGPEPVSYIGLFHGVIKTIAPSRDSTAETMTDAPKVTRQSAHGSTANRSGFLRVGIDAKKKATGCFMFFVDGQVLTGELAGASEQSTGDNRPPLRLEAKRTPGLPNGKPIPLAAVGRLQLAARNHRRVTTNPPIDVAGDEVNIRFV